RIQGTIEFKVFVKSGINKVYLTFRIKNKFLLYQKMAKTLKRKSKKGDEIFETTTKVDPTPSIEDSVVTISATSIDIDDLIDEYVVIIATNRKSVVWKYFGRLFNNRTGVYINENFNYCNLCLHGLQAGSGDASAAEIQKLILSVHKFKSGTSTTNLCNHLSDIHKIKEKEVKKMVRKIRFRSGQLEQQMNLIHQKHPTTAAIT
ncbi:hypothetical protein Bhyg_02293, partial [Pseudolycoriella hygida]